MSWKYSPWSEWARMSPVSVLSRNRLPCLATTGWSARGTADRFFSGTGVEACRVSVLLSGIRLLVHDADALYLDQQLGSGQARFDGRAARPGLGDQFAVDGVHGLEQAHVGEKDGGLDQAVQRRAAGLQHGAQVVDGLARLAGDVRTGDLAGARVGADLAGGEHKAIGAHPGRERQRRRGHIGAGDDFAHAAGPPPSGLERVRAPPPAAPGAAPKPGMPGG